MHTTSQPPSQLQEQRKFLCKGTTPSKRQPAENPNSTKMTDQPRRRYKTLQHPYSAAPRALCTKLAIACAVLAAPTAAAGVPAQALCHTLTKLPTRA